MTPELNNAAPRPGGNESNGSGGNTEVLCYREYDKPCGCVKCEEYFKNLADRQAEEPK